MISTLLLLSNVAVSQNLPRRYFHYFAHTSNLAARSESSPHCVGIQISNYKLRNREIAPKNLKPAREKKCWRFRMMNEIDWGRNDQSRLSTSWRRRRILIFARRRRVLNIASRFEGKREETLKQEEDIRLAYVFLLLLKKSHVWCWRF